MRTTSFLKILTIVFVFVSCSTGRNAFKRGDYYAATLQAVQHLRLKPDSEKASTTLIQSYPMTLDYYGQLIDALGISNDEDKYVKIVDIYEKLNTVADEIARCPAALELTKPVVYYHDQLNLAKERATVEQFNLSQVLLKSGNFQDAQEAYRRLLKVQLLNPNYPDIRTKLIEAEDFATLKIVVEQIPVNSEMYSVSARMFYNNMYSHLKKEVERQFFKFYKPEDAEDLQLIPHEIIRMQFDDFTIGNLREKESAQQYTSDSLVVGDYTDDNGNTHNVYGVVNAKATIFEHEIVSRGILNVKVIDYRTNEIITSQKFTGEYIWQNSWASFNGDERALPSRLLKMAQHKQKSPPLPQEMFLLFSDPIYSNASAFLKTHYKKR